MIYLDNCATTKPRKEVVELIIKALSEDFANPSSLHSFGHKIEKKIDTVRDNVAKILNVDSNEIYFTSGGTESNNIAIHGYTLKAKRLNKKIVTTKIEHASILEQIRHYKNEGFEVVEIGVDNNANLDLETLYKECKDASILSLFHINNEIGTINPVEDIIKNVRAINKNIYIHVDGVQAFGKIKVDLRKINCDSYSISSHKIYGPKGIGVFYLKNSTQIDSLVIGGGQEKGLRSGTENVPGIIGFGLAAEMMDKNFDLEHNNAIETKKYLIEKVKEIEDVNINTPENSSPYILSISILNVRAEVLLHYLEQDEIYISTASACTSNGTHKSHVLEAIGLNEKFSEGTIRICISKDIGKPEIDEFVEKLKIYVGEIREIMKR